jgi:hypothetical protein
LTDAPPSSIGERLPQTVFGFTWLHTKLQQVYILAVVLLSMPT